MMPWLRGSHWVTEEIDQIRDDPIAESKENPKLELQTSQKDIDTPSKKPSFSDKSKLPNEPLPNDKSTHSKEPSSKVKSNHSKYNIIGNVEEGLRLHKGVLNN